MTTWIHSFKLIVLAFALAIHGGGEQLDHVHEEETVELHHRRD